MRMVIVAAAVFAVFGVVRIETLFLTKGRELANASGAFAVIPRNSRVLPVVRIRYEDNLVGMGEIHHLEYGVIEKGLLVPSVFHIPGIQPLRLVGAGYCPNDFCLVFQSPENIEWKKVAAHYDYIWVEHFPSAVPYVANIADRVFASEFVSVYRVRRLGTVGGTSAPGSADLVH
jgi:hypothetical protein